MENHDNVIERERSTGEGFLREWRDECYLFRSIVFRSS
jgi:hypothetical protein